MKKIQIPLDLELVLLLSIAVNLVICLVSFGIACFYAAWGDPIGLPTRIFTNLGNNLFFEISLGLAVVSATIYWYFYPDPFGI